MEATTTCIDYAGRQIAFSEYLIGHITKKRPEVLNYVERICDVLEEPDIVILKGSSPNNSFWYYKLGITSGKFAGTYLAVVVRFGEEETGLVRTMLATSRLVTGRVMLMGSTS